jgi:hypothetical protein
MSIVLRNCVFDCPKELAVNAEAGVDVDASNTFNADQCPEFTVREIGLRSIHGRKMRYRWDETLIASWAYRASLGSFAVLFCVKALLLRPRVAKG